MADHPPGFTGGSSAPAPINTPWRAPRTYRAPPAHQTESQFDIKVWEVGDNLESYRSARRWLTLNLEREVYAGLSDVARAWQTASRAAAPERTGELRRSISVRARRDGIFLTASAIHAGWVHFGTKWQRAQPFAQEGWKAIGGKVSSDKAIQPGRIHQRVAEAAAEAVRKSGIEVTSA